MLVNFEDGRALQAQPFHIGLPGAELTKKPWPLEALLKIASGDSPDHTRSRKVSLGVMEVQVWLYFWELRMLQ